ncbi:MAG: helix-turn-helix domain-containing protein [bacterium]
MREAADTALRLGRGAAERPVEVRARLLDEATRLFAAQGYDGTPLQQIADAVGVRKPSLLYHFPSKEELRQAVLDALLSRWADVLPRLLMAATAGDQIFEAVVREAVGFFTADPNRARLLVRELLDHPQEMRERLLTQLRPWIAVIARYLRKGQELGAVRTEVDPEAYIVVVTNLIVSGIASTELLGGVVDGDAPRPGADQRLVRELIRVAHDSLFQSHARKTASRTRVPATDTANRAGRKPSRRAGAASARPRRPS